jgi:demethylmenaquinone methyltransferase/2-methoxy-6-polyprenyl-1,4-benzoquinol methylase
MTLAQTTAPHAEQLSFGAPAIKSLFDEMVSTYGRAGTVASLGLSQRWRRQCVAAAGIRPGMTVCDLMTGTGEAWAAIGARLQGDGKIIAVDFSAGMLEHAARQARRSSIEVSLRAEDAFHTSIPDASVDCVVSTFGLKTCAPEQMLLLAREVARILKPGGTCSLIEISVPPARWLRQPYLWYVNYVIPAIGRLFLGNPANYRMLGRYTQEFGDCAAMVEIMGRAGLDVQQVRYLGGCATGVVGRKARRNT